MLTLFVNIVFSYSVRFLICSAIGKNIHRILYLKQIDENELLSCELTVNTKRYGKRLDQKLTNDFETLVKSCKMVD